ncbi:MAG: protein TolQ [Rhodospirillaceae bacterium]|nr:protein TolQ [Rhodospirillaceae bacterium]
MDHLLSDLLAGLLGGFDLSHAGRGLGLDLNHLGHFLGVQDVTPLPAEPVENAGALPGLQGVGSGVEGSTPNQLELWHLFLAADIVVKAVMMLLVAASVWCWAIIFEKWVRLRRLRRRAAAFEDTFWSGNSLEELYDRIGDDPRDPMAAVFVAGMKEWRHANQRGLISTGTMRAGLHQRIERVMAVAQTRELSRVEGNMTFLASTGSVAPFVGLFGTVWGIMNAFTSIAAAENTSLAVVAPGIAEALFATALGLFAAIPASAFYNKFINDIARYAERLENFAGEFSAILSRHLEERG